MASVTSSYTPQVFTQLQAQALPPATTANAEAAGAVSGAETITAPSDGVTLSSPGQRLAQSTLDAASRNTDLRKMRCYKFVKQGLAAEGVEVTGRSAYMAAPQLARNPNFQEMKGVRPSQLSELPAGAVVVWNRSGKHPNGHISVALGDGREVSDRVRQQIEGYGTAVRVFLPNGGPTTLTAGNSNGAPAAPAG